MELPTFFSSFSRGTLFKSALIVSVIWLVLGAGLDGYEKTKLQNDVLCLGCLALDPKAEDFEGFWVEHPEDGKVPQHPDWVEDDLENKKAVFIFLWSKGCVPCQEQWDEMKEKGLVEGEEKDGTLAKYTQDVSFYTLDAGSEGKGKEAIDIYDPNGGSSGTPQSIFITTSEDTNDTAVYWWAAEGKIKTSLAETVIEAAIDK